jgi:hypothetical protein
MGKLMKAYVWRTGEIEFTTNKREDALPLFDSVSPKLRDIIEVLARHCRLSKKLLVPGVPEADTEEDALIAIILFIQVVKYRERRNKGS